jgi:hypothetical protein
MSASGRQEVHCQLFTTPKKMSASGRQEVHCQLFTTPKKKCLHLAVRKSTVSYLQRLKKMSASGRQEVHCQLFTRRFAFIFSPVSRISLLYIREQTHNPRYAPQKN